MSEEHSSAVCSYCERHVGTKWPWEQRVHICLEMLSVWKTTWLFLLPSLSLISSNPFHSSQPWSPPVTEQKSVDAWKLSM